MFYCLTLFVLECGIVELDLVRTGSLRAQGWDEKSSAGETQNNYCSSGVVTLGLSPRMSCSCGDSDLRFESENELGLRLPLIWWGVLDCILVSLFLGLCLVSPLGCVLFWC